MWWCSHGSSANSSVISYYLHGKGYQYSIQVQYLCQLSKDVTILLANLILMYRNALYLEHGQEVNMFFRPVSLIKTLFSMPCRVCSTKCLFFVAPLCTRKLSFKIPVLTFAVQKILTFFCLVQIYGQYYISSMYIALLSLADNLCV